MQLLPQKPSSPSVFEALRSRAGVRAQASVRVRFLLLAFPALLTIGAMVALAFQPVEGAVAAAVWQFVLPHAALQTLLFTGMVVVWALTMALPVAFLLAFLQAHSAFLPRGLLWSMATFMALPLAVPATITAAVYLELFASAPPLLRGLFAEDLRGPVTAAFFVALSFYPYVFVAALLAFRGPAFEHYLVARSMGASALRAFTRVCLPVSWPFLAAGLTLVWLEALNEVGVASLFGLKTLPIMIFETWTVRESVGLAARLSVGLLAVVMFVVLLERKARAMRDASVRASARREAELGAPQPARALWRRFFGLMLLIVCCWPMVLGLLVPMLYLLHHGAGALMAGGGASHSQLFDTLKNSLLLALGVGLVAGLMALVAQTGLRLYRGAFAAGSVRFAMLGYAIPGTLVALCLLPVLGTADDALIPLLRGMGVPVTVLFVGSGAALVLALVLRFAAVAEGQIAGAYQQLSRNVDRAARLYGLRDWALLTRVHLPQIAPAWLGGMALVMVDTLKELPASLILRPLNFETIATRLFSAASGGFFEDAALECLVLVVLAGVVTFVWARQLMR